jgi:PPM family protein phosphatase
MICAGMTHPGRRRTNNEDAFAIEPGIRAAILADGMGGENCGEVASALTVEAARRYLRAPEPGLTLEEISREAVRAANAGVFAAAGCRAECRGMGSTVVLALWRPPELVIANAGDSRAYLFRNEMLRQLSYDQSFANELRHKLGYSEERVAAMPNRNVLTMAVGIFEEVKVRTHVETLVPGDRILLCSDGLYGPVKEPVIAEILSGPEEPQAKVEILIGCANDNGGPDNVTVILMEYGKG